MMPLLLLAFACKREPPSASSSAKSASPVAQTAAPAARAVIQGMVAFTGAAPVLPPKKTEGDPHCALQHPQGAPDESVIVNANGTLKNVLVYVKSGLPDPRSPVPTTAVKLDQVNCLYTPRVLGVRAGQDLEIHNSDDTFHNVHASANLNSGFNFAQPRKGDRATRRFSRPEIMVRLKCDVHPWMAAYVGVFDHPFFAVTGGDGTFSIGGLPAGKYTLEAWHETYGVKALDVALAEEETQDVRIYFP